MSELLVIPNVYGIVLSEDGNELSILLQKRWKPESDPTNTGGWELPGGKWRAWESAQDCLRREVMEESGVTVDRFRRAVVSTDHNGQKVQRVEPLVVVQMLEGPYPSIILVLEATGSGTPAERGDGSRDAQWVPLRTLEDRLRTDKADFTPLSFAALEAWTHSTARE